MTMPKQNEIEIPLLKAINELGGSARPADIYPLVTKQFKCLTEEELSETVSGENKWTNRIQWTRQKLIDKGEISNEQRGKWIITAQGKERIVSNSTTIKNIDSKNFNTNLIEIYDEYEDDFKSQLLDKLHELTPTQFEEFAKKILQAYGFIEVNVTKVGPDGGIDGYGKLKFGLATINAAFQCKRWQKNISSKDIREFRGAIQGMYEQGLYFTTSDFARGVEKLSIQPGAVPIIMFNGYSIVDIMLEKELGVERRPLYLYYDKVKEFMVEEESTIPIK